jgi:Na+/H+-dicarboxylate symporter
MNEIRALTNLIGNAVAALVVARWEGEIDLVTARGVLDGDIVPVAEQDEELAGRPANLPGAPQIVA